MAANTVSNYVELETHLISRRCVLIIVYVCRELAASTDEERQELREHRIYDDRYTFRLLQEASKICGEAKLITKISNNSSMRSTTGVSKTELQEGFGKRFFLWCCEYGYDRTLQVLGATVREFLSNLDALHDHLASNLFPGMRAPSFRCTDGLSGEILLHYYSCRRGLQHIVIGIIKAVCYQLHNTIVDMEVVQEIDDTHDHVIFVIRELGEAQNDTEPDSTKRYRMQTFKPDFSYIEKVSWSPVPPMHFCQIFPFHIMFDEQQRICQMGTLLFHVVRTYNINVEHAKLGDVFVVERPHGITLNFSDIKSHVNMVFILNCKKCSPTEPLRLKGQMML